MCSQKAIVKSEKPPIKKRMIGLVQETIRGNGTCSAGIGRRGVYSWIHSLYPSLSPKKQFDRKARLFTGKGPETPISPVPSYSGRGLVVPVLLILLTITTTMIQTVYSQNLNPYPRLEEYIQIAIEQNPELQSMRYRADAASELAREAGVLPDPEINIAYDFNPMMTESQLGRFSVSAMQMFPWFGTLNARRNAGEAAADAEHAQIGTRQLEILQDIKITWFNIAEVREQIRIAEENLDLLNNLEVLVEARYETARAGQADILRIQMESQRLQTRIRDLEDELNPIRTEFNRLLNRDLNEEVNSDEITETSLPAPEEDIRNWVRSRHPAFDELNARKTSAEEQRRLAKYNGRPGFGLGLEVMGRDFGPMSMNPDATESFIGMATIRVPLFRARTQSQLRQADLQLRSIQARENQTEDLLISRLENSLEQLRKSERGLQLLDEELIPRAEQALNILTEEYSAGNARFDELLQIQRELLNLQMERIETLANQNRALSRVESLIGGENNKY
jgi:outer membrane protein, heavy metal efflux system